MDLTPEQEFALDWREVDLEEARFDEERLQNQVNTALEILRISKGEDGESWKSGVGQELVIAAEDYLISYLRSKVGERLHDGADCQVIEGGTEDSSQVV